MTHPLNILLLVSAGVSAALTGSWLPLVVGAAAEVLWLVVFRGRAMRSGPLQAMSTDSVETLRDQQARLSRVSEALRRRFLALDLRRTEIRQLVGARDELAQAMVGPELDKLDHLVDRFLDLAVRATELDRIAEEQDLEGLETATRTAKTDPARVEAEAQLQDAARVHRERQAAHDALARIERGLTSIRNRVATLGSPDDLVHDMDEITRGVAAAAEAVRETEAVTPAARASRSLKH